MVQVLARPVAVRQAPPSLEEFEAQVIKLGWSHYYQHGKIEIAQSAQRITCVQGLRAEEHILLAKDLDGLPVAYVGRSNFVCVIHSDPETEEENIRGTIIPAQVAVRLHYSNIFFSFGLQHIGETLYTCNISINRLVLKAN